MSEPAKMELDPKYDDYDFPTVAPVPQPGHPGHLTAEQQAQVHLLRMQLEAEGYTKRLDTLTLVSLFPRQVPTMPPLGLSGETGVNAVVAVLMLHTVAIPTRAQVQHRAVEEDVRRPIRWRT
jgi:hypothetical protein